MAGTFSQNFIERVIDANDIVSVISQHTALKKSGPRYTGLCPFHHEKTPSFTVTPDKQLYYCFGCQRGGNVISFVMEVYKYTFPEAVEYLAGRAGIPLEYQQGYAADSDAYQKKKQLYQVNKDAALFYYAAMRASEKAQQYLEKRGLSAATVKAFGIGYAPQGRSALYRYLKGKDYADELLLASGLVRKSDARATYYDYFEDRVMFPILNVSGNVVAFGGRLMEAAKNSPKYLNSPETAVFTKHATLFNLNNAKNATDKQPLIVVEGYMDVISLYDKGVKNACATLGTALNKEHAKLMMKYTKNVVLCYDADEAGRNATLRAIDILSAEGLEPRVLALENGEDPDSYVVKYGRGAFEQRVAQSVYYTDYKINILKEKYDLNDIVQMAAFIKEASAAAAQTKDEIKWDYYVKKIASMTQAEPVLIKNQIAKCAKDGGGAAPDELMQTAAPGAAEEAQKCILKYLLDDAAHMADFYAAGGDLGCFIGEDYALLYEEIEKCYSADRNVDILKHLAYNNKLASLAVAVDSHAAVSDLDQIKDCIKTLRIGLYETELKALKRRIEASEKEADGVDASLLKEYSYLKKKLLDTKSEVKRI